MEAMAKDGFDFGIGWNVRVKLVPNRVECMEQIDDQLAKFAERIMHKCGVEEPLDLVWDSSELVKSFGKWESGHVCCIEESRVKGWIRNRKLNMLVCTPIDKCPQEGIMM